MTRNPIRTLKSLFPWPDERPGLPKRSERWFSAKKQVLLRKVIPSDVKLIVELGSWLGDSTQWFCKQYPEATVVAVDTWLGSTEHLVKRHTLLPVLYDTFLVNCWEYRDRLIPFRNTSLGALNFLSQLKLKPDAIYFDSDHSLWGLLSELEVANSLFSEAVFIGDDYTTSNTVGDALRTFTEYEQPSQGCSMWRGWTIESLNYTWTVRKK